MRGRREERGAVGQVERDAPVRRAERLEAAPDDLARRQQGVQVRGPVALDARRKDFGLEGGRRNRIALELLDGGEKRLEAGARLRDALPRREEAGERRWLDGFDLAPKLRERTPLDGAERSGVGPLAGTAARQELSLDDASPLGQAVEGEAHHADRQAPPCGRVFEPERPVRSGVARDEIRDGLAALWRLEKRGGQAGRRNDAESVAQPAGVLRRGEPRLAGDPHGNDAPLPHERLEPERRLVGSLAPLADLLLAEISEREQQIVQTVRVAHAPSFEALERTFEVLDRPGIEELPQLRFAEQLPQLRLVDRERLGAALGERGVGVVDEVGDVGEQERCGKGRRRPGVARDDADRPGRDPRRMSFRPGRSKTSRRHSR